MDSALANHNGYKPAWEVTMESSDREDNAEGKESFERNFDMEETEESMLVAYETLAPEMRPESGSNGKSVK